MKTVLQAMRLAGAEPFPSIYVDSKEKDGEFELVAKSQLKKIQKIWVRENYKQNDKSKKELEDAERRNKNLEEARKIVITADSSLPEAKTIKVFEGKNFVIDLKHLNYVLCLGEKFRGIRVVIFGWAHRIRRQGKSLMFITLRDGTGFLQCVLTDILCQTYDALVLSTESSVKLYGTVLEVPEGKLVGTLTF